MKKAYAHTASKGSDDSAWQELSAHLAGVAKRARNFSTPFGSEAWATWPARGMISGSINREGWRISNVDLN